MGMYLTRYPTSLVHIPGVGCEDLKINSCNKGVCAIAIKAIYTIVCELCATKLRATGLAKNKAQSEQNIVYIAAQATTQTV